ncbi:MAG: nuclear transport factor 2 family protein [Bacteroidales bacterium]|nr:nuclear transport factor 2 family protein [Bacteroidales bacterium]MBN2756913.1 nuclear transport factor 2 family protein [Bacteroidales bacterium]
MKRLVVLYFLIVITFIACNSGSKQSNLEEIKSEIIKVEADFAEMVKNKGIADAFLHFADQKAVLNRNNELIKGKGKIKSYFNNQKLANVHLEWKPEFVDVSISGDLAYTYGHYVFSAINEQGETINNEGIFHTVWKKQTDGTWKFVWD